MKVAGDADAQGYFVDSLLRAPPAVATDASVSTPAPSDAQIRDEVGRIFATSIATGDLSAADRTYLGQVVARRAGIDPVQGEQRVNDVYAQFKQSVERAKTTAKEAADATRKASAGIAVWLFISLLCGAFFASLSATIGGRHRDVFVHGPRTAHR
jgi:hypothetical protein